MKQLRRAASSLGFFARVQLLVLGLLASVAIGRADIDQALTQSVWKLAYRVTDAQMASSTWLAADDDKDGISNGAEIAAGTDPFSANSTIKISSMSVDGSGVHLSFPTVMKKNYLVQSTTTLGNPASWGFVAGAQVVGDGTTKTIVTPYTADTFYRVLVGDLDSDGDGVSDWAEAQVGYNSSKVKSNNVSGDHDALAAALAGENIVTVTASKPTATRPGDNLSAATDIGTITISRTNTLLFSTITVPLTKLGTAVEGTDYVSLPTSVTFTPRVSSITLYVTPSAAGVKTAKAATVRAETGGGYNLATQKSASVIIYPGATPSGTGLTGVYYTGSNSLYAAPVNFGGSTVTYSYSKTNTTTGVASVTYSGTGNFQAGLRVNLKFSTGNLAGGTYDQVYVIASNSGTTFTVPITGAAVPVTGVGNCVLNPPVFTRIDPNVDFTWIYGTPNGIGGVPADNYSDTFEAYLAPTAPGSYQFQLDADDKARVFVDLNRNGVFEASEQVAEHNWDAPATVGVFKEGTPVTLAAATTPAERYKIRVEHVETTGEARCRLQWRLGTAAYATLPQAATYTHTQVATYAFNKLTATTGTATISLTGHGLVNGNSVKVAFSGSNLFTPVSYSGTYTVTNATANAFDIAITGAAVPNSVGANQTCFLENRTASTTTGVLNRTYANTNFTDPPGRVGVDAMVSGNNGLWGTGTPDPSLWQDNYVVRWTGQVVPQYSEVYNFAVKSDDGCKLWVNGQLLIDKWQSQNSEWIASIPLQAGVFYDIKLEYVEFTGNSEVHLAWFSPSQVKQAIPTSRLYPQISTTDPILAVNAAPTAATNALSAIAFVGQPFSFTMTASNSANLTTAFALASGAYPPGNPVFALNPLTGVISGTPTAPGDYQVTINATNTIGAGSTVLNIRVIDAGGTVTREVTPGLAGTGINDIPQPIGSADHDNILPNIEDNPTLRGTLPNGSTDNYSNRTGERLRGYITAPATGNYYFWLSGNNVAEFWLSNDAEPVNKVRRATVAAPGTGPRVWGAQATQKSPWISLNAGDRYYFEVLHNNGDTNGAADHVALGWVLDATGSSTAITDGSGLVPSYVLSPYNYPANVAAAGVLYATNLQPQGVASTSAQGSANLRLNEEETQAVLHFTYSGLSSPRTAYHIHADAYKGHAQGDIIYDIDDIDKFHPELRTEDGGYIWNFDPVGTHSTADMIFALKNGFCYLNVHSVNNPSGEIRGNLSLVVGSQSAPDFVPDPGYTDDHTTIAGAARFLNQAAFGAHPTDMAYVQANGYAAWIDNQFAKPATLLVPEVLANVTTDINAPYPSTNTFNAWWKRAVLADDQLRQRVAFALSEIMVVSDVGPLNTNGRILADFYDNLLTNSTTDFRSLLKDVTLTPAMGLYLDMRGNQKEDMALGRHPNENYGREIMQLFSIGLYRLWPDGTFVLDSKGSLVPTYGQPEIEGVSRALTGWNYNQALQANGRLPTGFNPAGNYIDPMVLVPTQHELGPKRVLDNVILRPAVGYNYPAANTAGSEADSAQVAYDTYCLADLDKALDSIANNPNVGPYICRQLIQRLVTSNPSPGYVYRVVNKFNDDGTGARGNFKAVVKAILLDGEARSLSAQTNASGKQREPIMRLASLGRTFPSSGTTGSYLTGATTAQNRFDITTVTPHGLSSGANVFLDFTGNLTATSPPAPVSNPTSTNYAVLSSPAPSPTTFSVAVTGMVSANYSQQAGSSSMAISVVGPPSATGGKVYLKFITGTGTDGIYPVATNTTSTFTVTMPDQTARSGVVFIPKISASYSVATAGAAGNRITTITLNTIGNHNLTANDTLFLAGVDAVNGAVNAVYTVTSVTDEDHLKIVFGAAASEPTNQSQNNNIIWPLVPPPLGRSGNIKFEASTFNIGYTNTDLTQTVLASTTVFNFFFPDYKFPGTLATANVTTPEFQLTTDTNIVSLTNALANTFLGTDGSNGTNTTGLCSYSNGAGKITLDLSAYQTAAWTSDANIPTLVNRMSDLLTGGTMTPQAKTAISNFVTTNLLYGTPTPTATQMRDRVRAVVHFIVISAEHAIQR